METNIWSI